MPARKQRASVLRRCPVHGTMMRPVVARHWRAIDQFQRLLVPRLHGRRCAPSPREVQVMPHARHVVSPLEHRVCPDALAAHPAFRPTRSLGRNKVQYDEFDFKVLATPHFDIYYYSSEADAAAEVAPHGRALAHAARQRAGARADRPAGRRPLRQPPGIRADERHRGRHRRIDRRRHRRRAAARGAAARRRRCAKPTTCSVMSSSTRSSTTSSAATRGRAAVVHRRDG